MKCLGESTPPLEETPYAAFGKEEWIMLFIEKYGNIDGANHKQWVIDAIAKILHGTPVIVRLAKWTDENGVVAQTEYRFSLGEPSPAHQAWLADWEEIDSEWDPGIPP